MVIKGRFGQLSQAFQTSVVKVLLYLLRSNVEEHEQNEGKPETFKVFTCLN